MMTKHKQSIIDRHLVAELETVKKIRLLMEAREDSIGRWAINRGLFPEQVHACLAGRRPYPEIREQIADFLGVDREQVDAAIDVANTLPANAA